MNPRIYKNNLLVLAALIAFRVTGFAQAGQLLPPSMPHTTNIGMNSVSISADSLALAINCNVDDFVNRTANFVAAISPNIEAQLNGRKASPLDLNHIVAGFNTEINGKATGLPTSYCSSDIDNTQENKIEKLKTYRKSYSLDVNDRVKLSNQYGKITVNTWDKREVKVEVTIKVIANNEDDAKRMLDGVSISDNKNDGQVSFLTSVEPGHNSSLWKMLNFGGKRAQKLEINYVVYMPLKTDLTVEDSYGAVILPDLDGKLKISSSYGSVIAQHLSNPANKIDGSYGSLKIAYLNAGSLDYSYGTVEIEQCNNLKADLSFGSFALGKLDGSADFDLSYATGFKIDGLADSFKKLNINSSYSAVVLRVSESSLNFDVTTTYCGFNFNDKKVTLTRKSPDDNRYHSPTKNYKGHVGKTGAQGLINIYSTYGGVKFE